MKNNLGFTLVELSIVLIIIGLLVSGVIAGKSLIQSTTRLNFINSINKYNVAVSTFHLKYDDLPGDMPNATSYWSECVDAASNLCNGNGDKKYRYPGIFVEKDRGWQHLSLAGLIPNHFDNSAYDNLSVKPGINSPELPSFNGRIACIVFTNEEHPLYGSLSGKNIFTVRSILASDGSNCWQAHLMLGYDAYSIDVKMDNGVRTTGKMTAYGNDGSCNGSVNGYEVSGVTGNGCLLNFALPFQ